MPELYSSTHPVPPVGLRFVLFVDSLDLDTPLTGRLIAGTGTGAVICPNLRSKHPKCSFQLGVADARHT